MFKRKPRVYTPEEMEAIRTKDFFDCIAPGAVKFYTDHYIVGNSCRCVWAVREYPPSTEEQAILSQLADRSGVTLRIYHRLVESTEQRKILQNATRKNQLMSGGRDVSETIEAQGNLQDVVELLANLRKNKEPLLHCAVFLELKARDLDTLKELQSDISMELTRSKLSVDRLTLRQKEGFLSVLPIGSNQFGAQFERVLPASSVANLYPFNFSGKTDPQGLYIGRDKYGTNILVDFDRRSEDKTTSNILILGNSGQGKSYLLKLLLCNVRENGKNVIALDSEHELEDLCGHLGGCFLDLLSGQYRINLLEPRRWDDGSEPEDPDAPPAFRGTLLAQHISFLRDIFRVYKGFDTPHIDTLELMIERLYQQWGISDETDLSQFGAMDYPVMTDLYGLIERTYQSYEQEPLPLYPPEMLRDLLLGLHSMCKGADSRFFNGHTNISSDRFLVFCVKGLDDVAENLRNTLLFNVLSYMSDRLLTAGNTAATIDELYLWLSNPVAITYIRNALKRVRKRGSSMVLASQNLEDFDQPGVRELTRPLFAIPTHQFLFNAGTIDKRFYMDLLQLEPEEYELIRQSQRGICLYKCGNERYHLRVIASPHKSAMFGTAGGT